MFGATNVVRNSDKEKWMHCGYGIAFDGSGSWNFGNADARNVVIFDDDNSSSSHTDNHTNKFLVLDERLTLEAWVYQRESLVLTAVNEGQSFVLVYITLHNSYLFVNGK